MSEPLETLELGAQSMINRGESGRSLHQPEHITAGQDGRLDAMGSCGPTVETHAPTPLSTGPETVEIAVGEHAILRPYGESSSEIGDRLALVDELADRIVNAGIPPNTQRAFDQDWAIWERFCGATGFSPHTISDGLLVTYVEWLKREGQSPATMHRRLTGVRSGWKRAKVDVPHGITGRARDTVRRHAKTLAQDDKPTGRGPARALEIPDLRAISRSLPDTLAGTRDRAILTMGFAVAARRSELAALTIPDITLHRDGMKVRVRDSKTGARHPAVRPGRDPLTCPVRAWEAWRDSSGLLEGPAFRAIDRSGNVRDRAMHPDSIRFIIDRAGQRADVAYKVTGHSLRSGFATEARRAGKDVKVIAKQGGWKENSAVLYGYMQIVDEWADNATEGIGL